MRERLEYEEFYKKHAMKILDHCLPTLPSAAEGFKVVEAYIEKSGRVRRGNEVLEYQVIRIYLKEVIHG